MLLRLIIEDYKSHREGLLSQGFWALLVYRLSRPRMHMRSRIIRVPYFVINRTMQKFIEITCGISLPEGVTVQRRLVIDHFGGIIIHPGVVFGDDVTLRQGVTIGNKAASNSKGAPILGSRIDIGAGAKIIGPIRIGSDVQIGANAVVTKDVPDGAIAVGVPARFILRNMADVEDRPL